MLKTKDNIFFKNYIVFIDQGLVSLGNFIISILIVKFSGLQIFGVFSFYWLIYILITNIQKSLIITPLLTNSPNVSEKNKDYFFGHLNIVQFLFASFFLIIIIFFSKTYLIIENMFGLSSNLFQQDLIEKFAIIVFLSTFFNFLRKEFFSKKFQVTALFLDIIVYFLIIGGLIFFKDYLEVDQIFNIFILSYAIAFLIYMFNLKNYKYSLSSFKRYFRQNWSLAKWMFSGSVFNNISNTLLFFNLGVVLGASVLGAVRACYQLANSCNIFFQAFENFWLFLISDDLKKDVKQMNKNLFDQIKNFLLILMPFMFAMIYFADFILPIFFTSEILPFTKIYIFMLLLIPILFINYPFEFALNVLQKPQAFFYVSILVFVITLLLSKYLILEYKVLGFGIILSSFHIVPAIVLYIFYLYYFKKKKVLNENT